jgi:hypothetical protein
MRRALARRSLSVLDPTLAPWGEVVLLADAVVRATRAGGCSDAVRVQPEARHLRLRMGDLVDVSVSAGGALASVAGCCVNETDEHGDFVPMRADDLDRITDEVREALALRALVLREETHELSRAEEAAVTMVTGGASLAHALVRVAGEGASYRSYGGTPYSIALIATEEGHAAVRAYIAAAVEELRAALP